jgi:hypothetical protein
MQNSVSALWGKYFVTGLQGSDITYPMFNAGVNGDGEHLIKIVGADSVDGTLRVFEDNLDATTDDGTTDQYASYALNIEGVSAKSYVIGNASDFADDAALIAAVQSLFE